MRCWRHWIFPIFRATLRQGNEESRAHCQLGRLHLFKSIFGSITQPCTVSIPGNLRDQLFPDEPKHCAVSVSIEGVVSELRFREAEPEVRYPSSLGRSRRIVPPQAYLDYRPKTPPPPLGPFPPPPPAMSPAPLYPLLDIGASSKQQTSLFVDRTRAGSSRESRRTSSSTRRTVGTPSPTPSDSSPSSRPPAATPPSSSPPTRSTWPDGGASPRTVSECEYREGGIDGLYNLLHRPVTTIRSSKGVVPYQCRQSRNNCDEIAEPRRVRKAKSLQVLARTRTHSLENKKRKWVVLPP